MSARDRRPERPSTMADSTTAGAGCPAPVASLLSVPIFRAAARGQAARTASERAGGPASPPLGPGAVAPAGEGAPAAPLGDSATALGRRPTPPAPGAVAGDQSYRSLLAYWRTLARRGRAPVARLDSELIAASWPYAMLIRVPRTGPVEITQVFAPGLGVEAQSAGADHPFTGEQASQISSWVLEIARDVAGSRQASRLQEVFHQTGRARPITADLLPCEADGDDADYLLLHLWTG